MTKVSSPVDCSHSLRRGSSMIFSFLFGMVVHWLITIGGPTTMSLQNNNNTIPNTNQKPRPPSSNSGIGNFLTLGEMKQQWRLPCNYIHDGFYLESSNRVLYQVYKTLTEGGLDDDDVPIMVEVGAHDGITKSISLKSSICLHVNTILIEATPSTYKVLESARAYDHTIHAALCEGTSVQMEENAENSGENKIVMSSKSNITVPCTNLDQELDKLAQANNIPSNRIKLVFLVLDVEGYEHIAIRGIKKYSPMKAMIEVLHLKEKSEFEAWYKNHSLSPAPCHIDQCFNFHTPFSESMGQASTKQLLYGARKRHYQSSHLTKQVAPNYMYYGE